MYKKLIFIFILCALVLFTPFIGGSISYNKITNKSDSTTPSVITSKTEGIEEHNNYAIYKGNIYIKNQKFWHALILVTYISTFKWSDQDIQKILLSITVDKNNSTKTTKGDYQDMKK